MSHSRQQGFRHWVVPASAILWSIAATAEPDLRQGDLIHGVMVYPDDQRPSLYYYTPGDIELARDDDSRPDFHLLSTRYTGTAMSGDQGDTRQRNLVSFRVQLNGPTAQQLKPVRQQLKQRRRGRLELRPLPIRQLLTQVVYTPVDEATDGTAARSHPLPGASVAESAGDSGGYWQERRYSLPLSAADAQVLRSALENDQVLLSLSYAFIAGGIGMSVPLREISGSPELTQLVEGDAQTADDSDSNKTLHTVRAGATAIVLDARRWPALLQQIDINEQLPPGYGVLEIHCYDFQNDNRPHLYEKQIEIEATSVSGQKIRQLVSFNADQSDRFMHHIRFPVAVRLDQPYRYRVEEFFWNGASHLVTDWTQRDSWVAILDISQSDQSQTPGYAPIDEPADEYIDEYLLAAPDNQAEESP